MPRTPTTAPGGLDYARCKKSELEAFYKDRVGKPIPEKALKKDLVKMLRQVDRYPWRYGKFRFMDLPPEMRNHIYSKLLIARPVKDEGRLVGVGCKPGLLRVCKQIESEGKGVLYGESEGSVELLSREAFNRRQGVLRTATVMFTKHAYACTSMNPRLVDTITTTAWPPHLLKFRTLRITVRIERHQHMHVHTHRLLHATSQALYLLASFLSKSKVLKVVKVKLEIEGIQFSNESLCRALWPATCLAPNIQLKTETMGNSVAQYLQAEKALITDTSENAVAKFFDMRSKAQKVEKLARKVRGHIDEIEEQMRKMTEALRISSYVTRETDEVLSKCTAEIEKYLESGIFKKLNDLIPARIQSIKEEQAVKMAELKDLQREVNEG